MYSKTKLLIVVLLIAIILFGFLKSQNNEQKINYTISPPPIHELILPCLMDYHENASIYTGNARSSDEVAKIWMNNVGLLEKKYNDSLKAGAYEKELYGNFLWSKNPDSIELRYRTSEDKYSKDGWYITTTQDIKNDGGYIGQFFLSNEGILMVAAQTCTRNGCCT